MSKLSKLSRIFTILAIPSALVFGFAFFFQGSNANLSQNSYYHLKFAQLLTHGDLQNEVKEALPHSIFKNGFLDQHVGFHGLVSVFQFIFGSAFAIKMLTSLSLALAVPFLCATFSSVSPLLIASAYFFSIFVFFKEFGRLFWERPQPLNILFLAIALWVTRQSRFPPWAYLILTFAAGLTSFEAGLLTVGCLSFATLFRTNGGGYWRYAVAGYFFSLLVFPFGIDKLIYLTSLLKNNILFEKHVSEWRPANEILVRTAVLQILFVLYALLSRIRPFQNRSSQQGDFMDFCALAALGMGLFAQRFGYLFVFFALLSVLARLNQYRLKHGVVVLFSVILCTVGAQQLYARKQTFEGDKSTLYSTDQFVAWFQQSPYFGSRFMNLKWEYWSQLFFLDHRIRSEPGFSMLIYQDDPELLKVYQRIRQETGTATLADWRKVFASFDCKYLLVDNRSSFLRVYRTKAWPFVSLYSDSQFTFLEFVDPRTDFMEYQDLADEAMLCVAESKSCLKKFVRRTINPDQIDLLFPISEKFLNVHRIPLGNGLVSFQSPKSGAWVYAEQYLTGDDYTLEMPYVQYWTFPFYKVADRWVLAEKNLPSTSVDEFLVNLERFYAGYLSKHDDVFYTLEKDNSEVTTHQRGRKLLGIYAICKLQRLQNHCRRLIQKYSRDDLDSFGLGTLSILGMILHEFPQFATKTTVAAVSNRILAHYDDQIKAWREKPGPASALLTGRTYMFSAGEALTYLLSRFSFSEKAWLKMELLKYADSYFRENDVYYVRWLLSAIFYAWQKNPSERESMQILFKRTIESVTRQFVYQDPSPEFFNGCYVNFKPTQATFDVDHHSGLILEGLSYFAQSPWALDWHPYIALTKNFARCTLKQQITAKNRKKMGVPENHIGGIRLTPRHPSLRIDILGHLGVGISQLAKNPALVRDLESADD